MKYSTAILLTVAGFACATPHAHQHQHRHHHVKKTVKDVTKIVYELNGLTIPESEVMQGIANGTLVWAQASEFAETPSTGPDLQHAQVAEPDYSSAPAPPAQTAEAPEPPADTPKPQTSFSDGDFPDYDDSVSCDDFPEAFGPIRLDYLGLNGWSGIQSPQSILAAGFNDILTIKADMFNGFTGQEGSLYSYACPIGYQKTQWPSTQGATGQSVGGLLCTDGKLTLTRGDVTKKLCSPGTDKITIKVKNTMSKGVAVCRTDYPGTESETIPTFVSGGEEHKLACPDADGLDAYVWEGKATSAQLYVNNAGVSQEDGCWWNEPGSGVGNYAPANIGIGFKDGKGWISIQQNAPTTYEKLDFTITIEGDDINGNCRYDAGKQAYCSGADYEDCNDLGCTTTVLSGTATYIFSN
ncbi:SUN-domain-containing protein [Pseudovirgaria hyperparasitica]|uniref:SUN-domain-containing protein n=1 Tax=Pseudovirgaria hyperparasitica TaxID=470096 RepID=A0A6A6W533_9PEZI|nr:SUN-domain-containing protein [Pseudovirgaria hyperparasitica]KAF2757703.1 SUN-domain-containing protein [Pseudovirgaria hyperparasitica]